MDPRHCAIALAAVAAFASAASAETIRIEMENLGYKPSAVSAHVELVVLDDQHGFRHCYNIASGWPGSAARSTWEDLLHRHTSSLTPRP